MDLDVLATTTTLLVVLLSQAACPGQGSCEDLEFVPLQLVRVSADEVAKRLTAAFGKDVDIFVSADSNIVWIRATAVTVQRARKIAERLDTCEPPNYLHVIRLNNVDAGATASAMKILMAMFTILGDDRDVHIVADMRSNSIIVCVCDDKAKQVEAIIGWLDSKAK
jgi:type II secretory pathway component GspD/PulD (secretin)